MVYSRVSMAAAFALDSPTSIRCFPAREWNSWTLALFGSRCLIARSQCRFGSSLLVDGNPWTMLSMSVISDHATRRHHGGISRRRLHPRRTHFSTSGWVSGKADSPRRASYDPPCSTIARKHTMGGCSEFLKGTNNVQHSPSLSSRFLSPWVNSPRQEKSCCETCSNLTILA